VSVRTRPRTYVSYSLYLRYVVLVGSDTTGIKKNYVLLPIEAHARTEVCASKALNSTPFCGCSTDTVLCDKTKNIINI